MSGTLRAAILAAADAVEEAREALCLLDATSGDGDHGVTMTIGARRVRSQLEQVSSDEPEALVRATAIGMAGAGGAIGAIYGRGLLAIAARLHEGPELIAGSNPGNDVARLELLASAIERAATATGRWPLPMPPPGTEPRPPPSSRPGSAAPRGTPSRAWAQSIPAQPRWRSSSMRWLPVRSGWRGPDPCQS